ncbi:hypothetical protein BDR07DRAFT_1426177 [Suillus spraguei]|nr:hypothetical protein BDR07DRAFT_1426177 [Suillus spraguei]
MSTPIIPVHRTKSVRGGPDRNKPPVSHVAYRLIQERDPGSFSTIRHVQVGA